MSLGFYMDVHVHGGITEALRERGVDVLTAQEDGTRVWPDEALLDRANELGRVLFTHDKDLLIEASRRQREDIEFGGVVYIHQRDVSVGRCVDDLELIARLSEPEEYRNRVEYLPL